MKISSQTPTKGRTPNEILAGDYVYDSAWHVHTAMSWVDFAKRERSPVALMYGGLQLRYAVELLWYELLSAAHPSITQTEYIQATAEATTLYRLIDKYSPFYWRFVAFGKVLASADSRPHPPIAEWDMSRLRRIHGGCGRKLLHLQGEPKVSFNSDEWYVDRLSFLDQSCSFIWEEMESSRNKLVFKPEGLKKPEVLELWEQFRDGKIDEDSVRLRLTIAQPILAQRPHTS